MEAMRPPSSVGRGEHARKLLVVAGDFLLLNSLRALLASDGFEVHCAAGPAEAMRLLLRYRYDGVVSEVDFAVGGPGVGLAVALRARATSPLSRIILLAATPDEARRHRSDLHGADGCYALPGDLEMVRAQCAAVPGVPAAMAARKGTLGW